MVDIENDVIQSRCFDTFQDTTDRTGMQVIVIDNGSHFGMEHAQEFADRYLRLPDPVGFARAVNLGWKIVETLPEPEIIGVLNNDLTFTPGWLPPLLEHLDDTTAAVAPSEQRFEGISDHIWSSCFFMQHATRQKIGFFDAEQLPYRYHDQDYWIRAKQLGYQFKRVGDSVVGHRESTTYKKMPQRANEGHEAEIMRQRWGVTMAQDYRAT